MPEAVVKAIQKKCEMGNRPKQCSPDISCRACGEKIAAIVEAKAKRRKKVAGGKPLVDGGRCYGAYCQGPIEYNIFVEEDGGQWHRIMEHDTKLLDKASGLYYTIDETALMATLGGWVSDKYPKVSNVDHSEHLVGNDILDARYDWGDGLYLKVRPKAEDMWQATADGKVRLSPEFEFYPDEVDDERIVHFVVPTGLGFMVDGQPLSEGSGPAAPDKDSLDANVVGGSNMDDGTEGGGDAAADAAAAKAAADTKTAADAAVAKATVDMKSAADAKTAADAAVAKVAAEQKKKEGGADPKPAPETEEKDELTLMKEQFATLQKDHDTLKTTHEDVLTENKDLEAARKEFVDTERTALLKELPEGYPDNIELKQMRADLIMHLDNQKTIKEQQVAAPTPKETDPFASAEYTDEDYAKDRAMEKELLGSDGWTPFQDTHYEGAQAAVPPSSEVSGTQYLNLKPEPPAKPKKTE